MSTSNIEPTVEPVAASTPEQNVSTQIVEEPVIDNTTAPTETTATPEVAKSEEEVSTAVVPSAEDTPVVATKSTETKRRTIFNPFAKSSKKEDTTPAGETTATETATEEKPKKATKTFGTFFSRSKSSPKVTDEESTPNSTAADATEGETVTATELPQIEQLQPIETDNIVATSSEDQDPTIKEAVAETVKSAEEQATEVTREVEQATTLLTTAIANKRQSFISKFFGGKSKKHDNITKEVEENAINATETAAADVAATTEEPTTESVDAGEQTEATEKVEAQQRPSSPLGRLTELFTSKKNGKKAVVAAATTDASPVAPPKEEETPTVLVTEADGDADTNVTEAATTVAAPVVTASA